MKTPHLRRPQTAILFALLLTGATAFAQSSLTNGLVAYYPFTGNATDQIDNALVGTVSGAVLAPDRFTNGNSAYSFDGSAQITVPVPSVSPLTISAWFKVGTIDHWYLAVWVRDTATSSQDDVYMNGNHPSYVSAGTVGYLYQSTGILSTKSYADGLWHQAVVRYNPSSQKRELYVDGALQGQTSVTNPPPAAMQNLTLGNANQDAFPNNEGFVGLLDDLRIYDRSLSPQEIVNLYQTESQPYPPGGPTITIRKAVRLEFQGLESSKTYQLQSTITLSPPNWQDVGAAFTAQATSVTNYADVADWNTFWRVKSVP